MFAIATGDYHTIVVASGCNCVDTLVGSSGACKGQKECNGGSDVYSWGSNTLGQVDGRASQEPVIKPIMIPFFVTNKPV